MASLNQVMILGRLTRDPEVRYLDSGTPCATLRMAINESYQNKKGEKKQNTTFVTVTVWGPQAKACGEYLAKGREVMIDGKLKTDVWEKDGQKHSRMAVTAKHVQFMGGGGKKDNTAKGESEPKTPAQQAATAGEVLSEEEDNLPF